MRFSVDQICDLSIPQIKAEDSGPTLYSHRILAATPVADSVDKGVFMTSVNCRGFAGASVMCIIHSFIHSLMGLFTNKRFLNTCVLGMGETDVLRHTFRNRSNFWV